MAALIKAIDRIDEVIALIRASASAAVAQQGLMELLDIDETPGPRDPRHAAAQAGRPGAPGADRRARRADGPDRRLEAILASPERQRQIIGTELAEIVAKFGDERRTQIVAYDGEVSDEDLIAEEDVVVTITRGGYAKRTKTDLYRAQRRGGKGVRGAQLRTDDIVEHFFVTTTHHWILFFTNKGRVYRAKAYELPEAGRDAKGQHVANLLAFQPDERIAEVLALRDYEVAPYLVLATRGGLVKKSRLSEFDSTGPAASSRSTCARTTRSSPPGWSRRSDDLLLVSRHAQSIRFPATMRSLRPMGRATSGVIGMRFTDGDSCSACT